jgi:hypothetical protein
MKVVARFALIDVRALRIYVVFCACVYILYCVTCVCIQMQNRVPRGHDALIIQPVFLSARVLPSSSLALALRPPVLHMQESRVVALSSREPQCIYDVIGVPL